MTQHLKALASLAEHQGLVPNNTWLLTWSYRPFWILLVPEFIYVHRHTHIDTHVYKYLKNKYLLKRDNQVLRSASTLKAMDPFKVSASVGHSSLVPTLVHLI